MSLEPKITRPRLQSGGYGGMPAHSFRGVVEQLLMDTAGHEGMKMYIARGRRE